MNERLRKTVTAAVFTALICVLTMFPQIYMPVTRGYVNLGDCLVLAAAWLLGAKYGGIAVALGSALADIITGYVHHFHHKRSYGSRRRPHRQSVP